jgi:hypothetical protein
VDVTQPEPDCFTCRYSIGMLAGLFCEKHRALVEEPCADYEREPGSEG